MIPIETCLTNRSSGATPASIARTGDSVDLSCREKIRSVSVSAPCGMAGALMGKASQYLQCTCGTCTLAGTCEAR
jgi:hypothetical protein